ncbi:B3 domain-containing protein, partial [Striga asiatica]
MASRFDPFVIIITDASSPTLALTDSIQHQYTNHVTVNCTIVTREHRTYEVWLVKVGNQLQFVDGWDYFVRAEDIRGDYILYFERNSLYEFIVKVFTCNSVERPPQYRFFVDIKKMHVQRTRLALMEHSDSHEFMDRSGIVEGMTCVFTLIGHECVLF